MKLRCTLSFSLCRIHSTSIPPRLKDSQPSAFWRIFRKYSHSGGLKRNSFSASSNASYRFFGKSGRLRILSNWSLFKWLCTEARVLSRFKKIFVYFESIRSAYEKNEGVRTNDGGTGFKRITQNEYIFQTLSRRFLTVCHRKRCPEPCNMQVARRIFQLCRLR